MNKIIKKNGRLNIDVGKILTRKYGQHSKKKKEVILER